VVSVDVERCKLVAGAVKKLRPASVTPIEVQFPESSETEALLYFYITAICHQTRKLANKKENLMGWEFLKNRFVNLAHTEPSFFTPSNLAHANIKEVKAKLAKLFSVDGCLMLTRPLERARFLVDCARVLDRNHGGSILNLLNESEGKTESLYSLLSICEAYKDPLRKKVGVLIRCLCKAKLLNLVDPENFKPIVDYHIMRVMLRTGCVNVENPQLLDKLRGFRKVSDDTEFRVASQLALKIIAKASDKTLFEIDDLFWALGRSCCFYKATLCSQGNCAKTPCTFAVMFNLKRHKRCVLQKVCLAATDEKRRMLKEPNVNTSNY